MKRPHWRVGVAASLGAILGSLVLTAPAASAHVAAPAAPAAQEQAQALATKRIAIVMIHFTNDQIDSSTAFRTKVRDMYFGPGLLNLDGYYREASNGAMAFAPLSGQPEVLGPWTITMAASCDNRTMNTKVREQLASRGISGYDSLSIWFSNRLAQCPWGGLAQKPGDTSWMPHNGHPAGVIHELGHNFGFSHLASVTCTTGTFSNCVDGGYRGSSPMGGGGYQSGLAAPELTHMGWLTPAQRLVAPASGTYTLTPLHAPASVSGARVLEIPRDSSGNRITVAYRKNGNTLDTAVGEGVQLHLTKQGAYQDSTLVDPSSSTSGKDDTDLNVGARITDATSGVTIETVSTTSTSATVRVTTGATAYSYVGVGGRCMDVTGASSANGTPIVLWTCGGAANQRWANPGDGTLRSLAKCLDAEASGTANGTRAILWDCNGGANQRWTHSGGALRNAATGACLDAGTGGSGTPLVLNSCTGGAGQIWTRQA